MNMNLDASFFSIVCELGTCLYTPETDLADMNMRQIIDDIRSGQVENVQAVLEFNPTEGWCTDVTDDVLEAAYTSTECVECITNANEENWSDYSKERIDGSRAGVTSKVAA